MKLTPYPKYKDSGIEWLGEIPEGWGVKRLKWLASLEYGSSLSEDDREEGDVPVYGSNGIVGKHSKSITGSPAIIIGRKGSYGKVSYSEAPCFPIDTTYYIDPCLTKENIRWIYYLLSSINLDKITFDTGVPGLSREFAYSKIVPVPIQKEQTTIASFLDQKTTKIDELIKKNERLIELLKEKRQAIISHAVTKGLDPNAKMKDSEIEWMGKIPEGWQTMPLRRIGRVVNGGTPESSNAYYWDGDIVWVTPDDLGKNQSKYITESKRKLTDEGYKSCSTTIIPKNSLIISTRAPIGHLALSALENCFNQGCRGIVFQNNYNPSFYYYYFSSLKDVLNSYGQGSTFFELGADKLASFYVAIPSLQEQIQIVTYLDQKTAKIDETIQKIQSQIDKLKEYRQALISNVVTGKVRVTGQS